MTWTSSNWPRGMLSFNACSSSSTRACNPFTGFPSPSLCPAILLCSRAFSSSSTRFLRLTTVSFSSSSSFPFSLSCRAASSSVTLCFSCWMASLSPPLSPSPFVFLLASSASISCVLALSCWFFRCTPSSGDSDPPSGFAPASSTE